MSSFDKIIFHNAKNFSGIVWKTIADEDKKRLFVETRNASEKRVQFSAFDFSTNTWLWTEKEFEEPWWMTLGYAQDETLLLTLYDEANDPEKKSLIAVDATTASIIWWKNNFVVAYLGKNSVVGLDTKFGSKQILLNLMTGQPSSEAVPDFSQKQNFSVIRPLQYVGGTEHFSTVKAFVERKCNFSPIDAIEYLEYQSWILISAFVQENGLANYLIVFNSEGEIVLKEQLGENLKGIAYDTFFLFAGFIIFVKNKRELVSYKIA